MPRYKDITGQVYGRIYNMTTHKVMSKRTLVVIVLLIIIWGLLIHFLAPTVHSSSVEEEYTIYIAAVPGIHTIHGSLIGGTLKSIFAFEGDNNNNTPVCYGTPDEFTCTVTSVPRQQPAIRFYYNVKPCMLGEVVVRYTIDGGEDIVESIRMIQSTNCIYLPMIPEQERLETWK